MLKKEAINKIQNHILKYGNCKKFSITTKMIKYWWNILNIAVFDSCLTPPKFCIKSIRNSDGQVTYGECQGIYHIGANGSKHLEVIIHINGDKIFTRQHFIAILVHEMVHNWQFEYREEVMHEKRMSHGTTFSQWRDIIENSVGVKLETYMDEDDVLASWVKK